MAARSQARAVQGSSSRPFSESVRSCVCERERVRERARQTERKRRREKEEKESDESVWASGRLCETQPTLPPYLIGAAIVVRVVVVAVFFVGGLRALFRAIPPYSGPVRCSGRSVARRTMAAEAAKAWLDERVAAAQNYGRRGSERGPRCVERGRRAAR